MSVTVRIEDFVTAAPALLAELPRGRREERRRLRHLIKWTSDPKLALAEIDKRRQQFDVLLRRATRQRNAVIHGAETVPSVIASCEPFVAGLAATVVATAINEARSDSTTVPDALERGRMIEARRLWRLENESASVGTILFG
jgi:hypothetical protein